MSFVFASTTYTAIEALVRLHLRQNTPVNGRRMLR